VQSHGVATVISDQLAEDALSLWLREKVPVTEHGVILSVR
jgi:hypothetical protein